MKPFIPVRKITFFVAMTKCGEPIPYFGFTFFKKQMLAKIKKEKRQGLIIAPVVFVDAQNFKEKI